MSFYLRPSLITFISDDYYDGFQLILSDAGRQPVTVDVERIENRERMASGRMRSKFIADKHSFSLEWEQLPSRTLADGVNVVADGYASANDLKEFYDAVKGEFTVRMYADNGQGPELTLDGIYDEYQCFFDSFSTTIAKRGRYFDLLDVSIGLVEA